MTKFAWPRDLSPRIPAFNKRGMTIGGPATLSGPGGVGSYDSGYWVARLSAINAGGPVNVNAYRALLAKLAGGANQVLVPVFDRPNAPWPNPGGPSANIAADQPWDDGFYFDDGRGWYEPAIEVSIAAATAIGATNISVTKTTIGTVRGGEFFSIGDWLYSLVAQLDDGTWWIAPGLVVATAIGDELNFDDPVCLMQLDMESSGDLALERGIYGFPDIDLVQAPAD